MRNLRKLLLLTVMAMIAATAFMASNASAQETVEVRREPTAGADEHCPALVMDNHRPVTTGGQNPCRIRATSETPSLLFLHNGVTEAQFSACTNVFEAAFNEDGVGFIYNQVLTPEGGACGREPCDEEEAPPVGEVPHRNLAWPASVSEPGEEGELEEMEVTFCLYPHDAAAASEGNAGTPCHIRLNVFQNKTTHAIEVRTKPVVGPGPADGGSPCTEAGQPPVEVVGHWNLAANAGHPNEVELVHHFNHPAG